jgi:hypothetical protein
MREVLSSVHATERDARDNALIHSHRATHGGWTAELQICTCISARASHLLWQHQVIAQHTERGAQACSGSTRSAGIGAAACRGLCSQHGGTCCNTAEQACRQPAPL